uniref:Uncharacterized protein n=1 Tax=Arundo donax TaxID=35708 RepID=A0A0A9G3P1_ARUDO
MRRTNVAIFFPVRRLHNAIHLHVYSLLKCIFCIACSDLIYISVRLMCL